MSLPSAPRRRGALRPWCRRTLRPSGPAAAVPFALAACLLCAMPLLADSEQERRAQVGVRLFRALLAADLGLEEKREGEAPLLLVVVYGTDRRLGEDVARSLRGGAAEPEPIRGMPVVVETTQARGLERYGTRSPAGVFIAQPADARDLAGFVRFGIDHRVIVYSPFEGDVERGIHAGLSVEAQVRPYVNTATLAASGIAIKPFFLKAAKAYP